MPRNLDDDFFDDDYESDGIRQVVLTPKAVILIALANSKTFSKMNVSSEVLTNIANETWSLFENFARRHYGQGKSFASVIFSQDGGMFQEIPVITKKPGNDFPLDDFPSDEE